MNIVEVKTKFERKLLSMGRSESTVKNYWKNVERFVSYCRKRNIKKYSDAIEDYIVYLMVDRKLAPNSVRQAGFALIFLYEKVLNTKIPFLDLPRGRAKKQPVVCTPEEIINIISKTYGVDNLLCSLMYGCGLRVKEACTLRVRDIDFNYNQITVDQGKGRKHRIVNLPGSLIAKLEHQIEKVNLLYKEDLMKVFFKGVHLPGYVSARYPSFAKQFEWQFLFSSRKLVDGVRWYRSTSSIQKVIYDAVKKSGVMKKVSAHTLRHSFATHQLAAGLNIRAVQDLLGHKSLNTTMIYTHVLDEQKRNVVDLLAPKTAGPNIIKIAS